MTKKAKVVSYYQELSKTYDQRRLGTEKSKIVSELQNEWFVNSLENTTLTVCLEIGCGTGRLTKDLVKKARILVAIDTSLEMIKINKNKITPSQKNEIHYLICDAAHLPFRNKTFTNVVSSRVLWHIRDYPQVVKEMLEVLNKNGSLQFDFPCLWGPFYLKSKLFGAKHEILTLFIDRKRIKQIFKKTKKLIIRGNTSMLLYLIPDKLFTIRAVNKAVCLFEKMNKPLFSYWLYTYYLIEVTK
jgi:ubiquinone/menaquinone biosynthesis C-methylase UbiE